MYLHATEKGDWRIVEGANHTMRVDLSRYESHVQYLSSTHNNMDDTDADVWVNSRYQTADVRDKSDEQIYSMIFSD